MTVCEHESEHEALVQRAKKAVPSGEIVKTMCEMLKILGEPSRMKIIFALMEGEMCVQHLVEAVDGNQSAVSQQLKVLKSGKLINIRREGKNILYSIADEHVYKIVEMSKEHAIEEV